MSLLDEIIGYEGHEPPHTPKNCQRWIPVSERKPDCDRVLLSDGRNVTIATRYAPGAYDAWDVWKKMPTHWMPLPEPPEVK
jgi:hypothetical protein